jgi:hypothetical protein
VGVCAVRTLPAPGADGVRGASDVNDPAGVLDRLPVGRIERRQVLGGLLNEYERAG